MPTTPDTIVPAAAILVELEAFCGKFDSAKLAAKNLKVTPSVLSQTRRGRNNVIPERILKKLGYKSGIVYIKPGTKTKSPTQRATENRIAPEPARVPPPETAQAAPSAVQVAPRPVAPPKAAAPKPAPAPAAAPATEVINLRGD